MGLTHHMTETIRITNGILMENSGLSPSMRVHLLVELLLLRYLRLPLQVLSFRQ
jgi:hypothetical protein